MRVHVLGLVSLNGGDAAIMAGQEVILRAQWPDAAITISDTRPDVAAQYVPGRHFHPFLRQHVEVPGKGPVQRLRTRLRRAWWRLVVETHGRGRHSWARLLSTRWQRRLLAPLVEADLIAYTGGTTLTDNYDLSDKLLDLTTAVRLRKPLVFLQQSAGPFHKPWNREALGRILPHAALVILRDERSRRHVIDVGASPERCIVLPDAAFALAPAEPAPTGHPSATDVAPGPRVAVSVRPWAHFDGFDAAEGMRRYTSAVAEAVGEVVRRRGAEVVFVSTCQGRPGCWVDDSALAMEIAESLPSDVRASVGVDRAARSPRELLEFLRGFDAMLSTRLHGGILAVSAGVPTLTIAYECKTTEVWNQLGLADWVLSIDDLDAGALTQRLLDLLARRDEVRGLVASGVPPLQQGALAAGPAIAGALARGVPS